MDQHYYTLPLSLDSIIQKKEHSRCLLSQSVAQHLHLLLTTAFGELLSDEGFGCSIWDIDFDNLTSAHKLKEMIKQSMLQAIKNYENRLDFVRVELGMRQEELPENTDSRRVKKRMDISVQGLLKATNENFIYKDSFFIGPLSYQ